MPLIETLMADPAGEAGRDAPRLDFDRRLRRQLRGSVIASDAGLLPYRELNHAVGLTETGADTLADVHCRQRAIACEMRCHAASAGRLSKATSAETGRTRPTGGEGGVKRGRGALSRHAPDSRVGAGVRED